MADLTGLEQDPIRKRRALRELIAYFALTFAMTWGLGAAFLLFRPQFEAVFGPVGPPTSSWPFYVVVCAPTISAVLLSAVFGGLEGVTNLFLGLVRPVRLSWVFISFLIYPAAYVVWGLVESFLFGHSVSHAIDIHAVLISAPLMLFTTTTIFMDPGDWGEEMGWRGFALPRLLTRFSPLTAAIILGVIWAVWHLPAFFNPSLVQSHFNFGWFLVGDTCLSISMAWIYVNANRNFLVAGFIPHVVNNILFGSRVITDVKIEAFVMISIVALIIAVSEPGLKGWRFAATTPAKA